MNLRIFSPLIVLIVSACGNEGGVATPTPEEIGGDAIGYYCGMMVKNHGGPKAQVHLRGKPEPLWFVSVRDAIAFTLLPEEPKSISVIYVTDMTSAEWQHPEAEMKNWIEADGAFYVIDSDRNGGMGAPEAVPFSHQADAEDFAREHLGRVVALADIPENYVLGAGVELYPVSGSSTE